MTDEQLLRRLRLGDTTLTWPERDRANAYDPGNPHNRRFWTGYHQDNVIHLPTPLGILLFWMLVLSPLVALCLLLVALTD